MATDESAWTAWQGLTGHRFPVLDELEPGSFCARCGLTLEGHWGRGETGHAALMRTRCPGPYREPWWLRLMRWLKGRP
jgi:hypothetical protein